MKTFVYILGVGLLLNMCSSSVYSHSSNIPEEIAVQISSKTILLNTVSKDKKYGYDKKKAVKVGTGGPANERIFLDNLAGPNGETISYRRTHSCCKFKTKNATFGGYLDVYEITYEGLEEPVILYLNMYDPGGEIHIPFGFTFAGDWL